MSFKHDVKKKVIYVINYSYFVPRLGGQISLCLLKTNNHKQQKKQWEVCDQTYISRHTDTYESAFQLGKTTSRADPILNYFNHLQYYMSVN